MGRGDTVIVFVVMLRERHIDEQITVHETLEGANAMVDQYGKDYEVEWIERSYGRPRWVRYVDCDNDDGPKCRIEEVTVLK